MDELKSLLVCFVCKNVLSCPVRVEPCGETMCGFHAVYARDVYCPLCDETHSTEGCESNETLVKLISSTSDGQWKHELDTTRSFVVSLRLLYALKETIIELKLLRTNAKTSTRRKFQIMDSFKRLANEVYQNQNDQNPTSQVVNTFNGDLSGSLDALIDSYSKFYESFMDRLAQYLTQTTYKPADLMDEYLASLKAGLRTAISNIWTHLRSAIGGNFSHRYMNVNYLINK